MTALLSPFVGVTNYVPIQNLRTVIGTADLLLFFKLGIAMEKCRAKNLFEKGVKKRCEIAKKGMKTPMKTIYILVAFK